MTRTAARGRGAVVTYATDPGLMRGHEWHTHTEIARRLAALKGFDFAGEYDAAKPPTQRCYFVPNNTLNRDVASSLGIENEQDLFGGVVPYAFVATKAITHPLVDDGAKAPGGWSEEFGRQVRHIVHAGYCVFTLDDASRAGSRLLEKGPARIKPARAAGGLGQVVVASQSELAAALETVDRSDMAECGLVLEENLTEVTTYSVGQAVVGDFRISYCGTQRLTPDNQGTMVYGGSDLIVARGRFDALLSLNLADDCRQAVDQARQYDAAVRRCFPGLLASRRNYDVAQGRDAAGRWRSGVLEQSWRIGGASGAEIMALEAFSADGTLPVVRAACVEVYGAQAAPPSGAKVYFRGSDQRAGPITKYAWVEAYGNS